MSTNDIEDARTWLIKKLWRAEKNYDDAMEREDYNAEKNLLKEIEIIDTLIKVIPEER